VENLNAGGCLEDLCTQDNINKDLQEIEWGGIYQINLTQDRDMSQTFVNKVMKLQVPQNVRSLVYLILRTLLHGVVGILELWPEVYEKQQILATIINVYIILPLPF
jgi:hypothetical protein